ncbi:MAG: hypothetical protein ABIH42_05290 [Planctomycetota bacterium]
MLDGNTRTTIALLSKINDKARLEALKNIEETNLKRAKVFKSINTQLNKL